MGRSVESWFLALYDKRPFMGSLVGLTLLFVAFSFIGVATAAINELAGLHRLQYSWRLDKRCRYKFGSWIGFHSMMASNVYNSQTKHGRVILLADPIKNGGITSKPEIKHKCLRVSMNIGFPLSIFRPDNRIGIMPPPIQFASNPGNQSNVKTPKSI